LSQFIMLFVCIYAIQLFALFLYIYWFDKPIFKIDWKIYREKEMYNLIRYGMLLWFAGVASIGLLYFDTLMVGKYMELKFVGFYAVAAFIPTVIDAPSIALEKIAAPKISFSWNAGNKNEIFNVYHK